jgi:hypothetical protein
VSLQRCSPELAGWHTGDVLPELLCGPRIAALVDEYTANDPVASHAHDLQESQEEADQGRVTVNEGDPIQLAPGFTLGAFAPVGDGRGNNGLPAAEPSY